MEVNPFQEGKTFEDELAQMKQMAGGVPFDAVLVGSNLTKEEAEQMKNEAKSCTEYYGEQVKAVSSEDQFKHVVKLMIGQKEVVKTPTLQIGDKDMPAPETVSKEEFAGAVKEGLTWLTIMSILPYLAIGGIIYLVMTSD